GDAVYLYDRSGNLVDVVCYGNYTASDGWTGIPVDLGFKEHVIRRVEPTDTNTYFDWVAIGNGYTAKSFADTKTVSADVKPFTFPECGGKPVLESLMGATKSVKISIYMLTSAYVGSVLADLEKKGVDVQVIIENKPLVQESTKTGEDVLKAIVDVGAEVKFIGGGTYDRYSYVHNKYAIIDDKEVIITSENWTDGNISTKGNRGWGAVIYGKEFAPQMNEFFMNDWNFNEDFIIFDAKYPSIEAATLPTVSTVESYVNSVDYAPKTYENVGTSIYMSPDNTFKALMYLIENADTRVYTEQMDIGSSFRTFATTSPLSAMINASDRGVDARFMVTKDKNVDFIEKLNTETNVKSAGMTRSGYQTMHNKGVIIDDTVWVSSVNWTDNAFMNNRECGLYLQSKEITQFYLDSYMSDWDYNYKLTDTITVKPDAARKTFTATGTTGTVEWSSYNVNNEVISSSTGTTFTIDSDDVNYIRVKDQSGNTGRYIIPGYSAPPSDEVNISEIVTENAPAIGIGAIILAVIGAMVAKVKKKGSKKKGKKKKSNKRK
ncbi:MAG: hypothetical protein KIG18_02345, partial [Candidatus Methanomethylophilaceae archaeon]|nr:hypothetical protein [Candidatus Methanomethylophilaceae archaeon]